MKKEQISLIGCGWLGLPLAERLSTLGHTMAITTTSAAKLKELEKKFRTYLLDVTKEKPNREILEADLIIYTVPPLGAEEVELFFKSIDENKKIIFISSTSVYGKNQGDVTEDSPFDPSSKNAMVLREAEAFLKTRFKRLTIIRPGGLYGEKRHPVYFLAGRSGITSGEEYLHLIHRDDCVKAIVKIIEQHFYGEDFNLVSDLRILKKHYYTEMAKKLGLAPPVFEEHKLSNPTKISNEKSKKMLSLHYINPNDWT
ncbi:MAG: NAD-dependent epimerase/dehydratase family protein [Bacteriovorax sp.]